MCEKEWVARVKMGLRRRSSRAYLSGESVRGDQGGGERGKLIQRWSRTITLWRGLRIFEFIHEPMAEVKKRCTRVNDLKCETVRIS